MYDTINEMYLIEIRNIVWDGRQQYNNMCIKIPTRLTRNHKTIQRI